jgi:cation diffusion facilitator CzcD-associated flavoprotein CzcO
MGGDGRNSSGMTSATTRTGTVIVGSGFAGLCMAIRLREAGISDFVILERANDVGGTWRDNDYPGCACDIPSVLYSFSFAPKSDWSRVYPTQPEIQAYLADCVRRFRLERHLRFGCDVVEARYDEAEARWHVRTASGETYVARAFVSAMGGLSNPYEPDIAGRETFAGPSFHSARWNHAVSLEGRDVAVIGTGASAIQFVPELAPRVRSLTVYQRTAPWIVPKLDGELGPRERALRRYLPLYGWLRRKLVYWLLEIRAIGFTVNPKLLAKNEGIALRHLERQIADPELRKAVWPDGRMGCKRVLISNDYYPALARPNVEVVTDAIARIEPDGIVTADGTKRRADAIVYGTGFRAQEAVGRARVIGAGGRTLADAWRDGMEAFLGVSVAGFPNMYLLIGPNTGLGHSSMVYMIESQTNYVLSAMRYVRERKAAALDIRPEVQRAFNEELQHRMKRTVWNSGCRSWYLDVNGRNTTLWPGFTFEFRRKTYRIAPRRYRVLHH